MLSLLSGAAIAARPRGRVQAGLANKLTDQQILTAKPVALFKSGDRFSFGCNYAVGRFRSVSVSAVEPGTVEANIGHTPLLRLRLFDNDLREGVEIFAKAEHLNPGGSVKDRAALSMILEGERSGKLKPGMTILDATSGNTGIAYAMIGASRGYRVKVCLPKNAEPAAQANPAKLWR